MGAARAQDILDWLHQVLQEHAKSESARGHESLVLAASLAERERWMPLVEVAFRAAGGEVVDATECGSGTDCGDVAGDAPGLVDMVRGVLTAYNLLDATADLALTIEDGRAEVVGSAPIDSVNAAQRAVREVSTAMCDIRLRSSDLVCIAYAEDALDDEVIAVVWVALMDLVHHIDARPETTLCVVSGDSSVRIGIHCVGDPSLRFRIDDARVQSRHGYGQSARAVRELGLYQQADAPLVVLFLGAGASASDGLPMGDKLRDIALGRLMGVQISPSTFDEVARRWFGQLDGDEHLEEHERAAGVEEFVRTLTLERVLEHEQAMEGTANCTTIRQFAAEHARLFADIDGKRIAGDLTHDPIVRLCARRGRLVLVTVNFDRFIEARVGDDVRPYFSADQLERFPEELSHYIEHGGPVPLLKLHGDIDDAQTLVATIGETNAGLTEPRQKAIESLIDAVARQFIKPWWYVGYSMRDRDLENVWKHPAFPEFNEHWVAPFLDPNVDDFIARHRRRRWAGQGFSLKWNASERLVSLTASDFLAEFAAVTETKWV